MVPGATGTLLPCELFEEEAKKRSVFFTHSGANTYKLLQNLIAPEKTNAKTYEKLVQVLANHYNLTPVESVQQFKFRSRIHRQRSQLQHLFRLLTEVCNFDGSTGRHAPGLPFSLVTFLLSSDSTEIITALHLFTNFLYGKTEAASIVHHRLTDLPYTLVTR